MPRRALSGVSLRGLHGGALGEALQKAVGEGGGGRFQGHPPVGLLRGSRRPACIHGAGDDVAGPPERPRFVRSDEAEPTAEFDLEHGPESVECGRPFVSEIDLALEQPYGPVVFASGGRLAPRGEGVAQAAPGPHREVALRRPIVEVAEPKRGHRAGGAGLHEPVPAAGAHDQDGEPEVPGGVDESTHSAGLSRPRTVVEGEAAGYPRAMPLVAWPVLVALFLGPPDAEGWRAHVERLSTAPGAEAALRLAGGLGRRGETAAARRWAEEARARGAAPIRVTLVLAETARVAEDWVAAAAGYFDVLTVAPSNPHAAVQLWHCLRLAPPQALLQTLDVTRLRTALEGQGFYVPEVFAYPPDLPRAAASVTAGFEALTRTDYDGARRAFQAAIADAPMSHDAWRGLGMTEAAAGNGAGARAAYLIYLGLDPPESQPTRRIRQIIVDDARRRGLAAERAQRPTGRRP